MVIRQCLGGRVSLRYLRHRESTHITNKDTFTMA